MGEHDDTPAVEKHGVELAHRGLPATSRPHQQQGLKVTKASPGQSEQPPHVSAVEEKEVIVRQEKGSGTRTGQGWR